MAAVVQVRVVVLSEVAPRAVGLVKVVDRAVRAKVRVKTAIKAKRSIMASLLLLQQTRKAQEMGLNEARQKGVNPSIKAPENRVIQAKASDF